MTSFKPVIPYSKTLGVFLKNARLQKGLSQNELALKLGYATAQVISNWERGQQSPPFDKLVEISKILKVPQKAIIEQLMNEHEKIYQRNWKKSAG